MNVVPINFVPFQKSTEIIITNFLINKWRLKPVTLIDLTTKTPIQDTIE